MVYKVLMSELGGVAPEDFRMAVDFHLDNIRAHRAHHEVVDAQARTGAEQTHTPYPAPVAPDMVEKAINRDALVVDYELVDDRPPAPTDEEKLRARRNEVIHDIRTLESKALHDVVPLGKVRARGMREQALRALGDDAKHGRDDREFLEQQDTDAQRLHAIRYHAAQMEALVEDLDEKELETWRPAPFPG